MGRTWNFVQCLRFVLALGPCTLTERSAAPGIVRSPMVSPPGPAVLLPC
jgi:hypothetical protein